MKHWIDAFRLKTLPLAAGAIILGSALHKRGFDAQIFLFALITAILLQILSNLANDYGDFLKGTDKHRKDRQLAGGKISTQSMKTAIVIFIILTLASGISLLTLAFEDNWNYWLTFFFIGLACIAAAIGYTVGKRAYGYFALGDLFVFLFFGGVGVLGSAYLYKQSIETPHIMAAFGYGLLCVGVLNINNIRDLDKDVLTNKITVASKLGKEGAIIYQAFLLVLAAVCFICHHLIIGYLSLAPFGALALAYYSYTQLHAAETEEDYNQQLKVVSLSSLLIVIFFLFRLFF